MRHGRGIGLALASVLSAAIVVQLSPPATGIPVAAAAPSTPVGTWRITYGAPALVTIESTGSGEYSMTAASPVTVVGATCQLPIGTAIATLTASGTGYAGRHGLWSTTNCAFARFTTMSLTVNGDRAVEKLGNGESRTLTRVASRPTSHDGRSWWWLWLLLLALLLLITLWLLWRRGRRRRT